MPPALDSPARVLRQIRHNIHIVFGCAQPRYQVAIHADFYSAGRRPLENTVLDSVLVIRDAEAMLMIRHRIAVRVVRDGNPMRMVRDIDVVAVVIEPMEMIPDAANT